MISKGFVITEICEGEEESPRGTAYPAAEAKHMIGEKGRAEHFLAGKSLHNVAQHLRVGGQLRRHGAQFSEADVKVSDAKPQQSQQLLRGDPLSSSLLVGGDTLPTSHIIGGTNLDEFVATERSPFAVVSRITREISHLEPRGRTSKKVERKFDLPEALTTARFLAQLRDIEQETFDLDAALRVAKLTGLKLDENDQEELRRALEDENREIRIDQAGSDLERRKPGQSRYTQLNKITDPRLSHDGPFLAPRKVRKQLDPMWEDMRTMKPAMSDLFNLKERCPQV